MKKALFATFCIAVLFVLITIMCPIKENLVIEEATVSVQQEIVYAYVTTEMLTNNYGRNLIVEYFNDFDNPESIKVYLQREKEFADVFRVFGYDFREVYKAYRDWGDNTRKYVFSFGFRIPSSDEYVSEDCYLPIPSIWQHRQRCPFELVNIERMRAELEKAKADYVADQEE